MGTILPEEGEAVRIVLMLKGGKEGLKDQKTYNACKAAIKKVVADYGVEMEEPEYVVLEKKKKPKRKSGK